jgi:hypothetical protein
MLVAIFAVAIPLVAPVLTHRALAEIRADHAARMNARACIRTARLISRAEPEVVAAARPAP